MAQKRSLVAKKAGGWGCKACGWVHPFPRMVAENIDQYEILKGEFRQHKCEDYPKLKKKIHEDVSQAAGD
jgi:hypothetical protein